MNSSKKHYTDLELDVIKTNFLKMGDKEIGLLIGRSECSVRKKIYELKLSPKNLIRLGDVFGRLTVIGKDESSLPGNPYYLVKCSCDGKIVSVRGSALREIATVSCGCFKNEKRFKKDGVSSWNQIITGYKHGAEQRGHIFSLTIENFIEIATQNCHYCGSAPSRKYNKYVKKDGTPNLRSGKLAYNKEAIDRAWIVYNGLDRIDNKNGYVKDNVVSCCTICNYAKHTLSYEEFMSYLERLVLYRNSIKGQLSLQSLHESTTKVI